MFAGRAGATTSAASASIRSGRGTELITLNLKFCCVNPAQITADGIVAMHATTQFGITFEIQTGEHNAVACDTLSGGE